MKKKNKVSYFMCYALVSGDIKIITYFLSASLSS